MALMSVDKAISVVMELSTLCVGLDSAALTQIVVRDQSAVAESALAVPVVTIMVARLKV
jgi:hypothetical protein